MGIVLRVLFLSMVMVCNWTLTIRKRLSVRTSNLLQASAARDDASPSFVAVGEGLKAHIKSCN